MAARKNAPSQVGGRVESLDAMSLELDPHNPRLSRAEEGASQPELIEIMLRRFKIEELAESIITAGFKPIDPMLGVRELEGVPRRRRGVGGSRGDPSKVVVMEGNRRLTAIKLLLDPDVAPEARRESWRRMSRRLRAADREAMKRIDVRVYDDRHDAELVAYIGFRHVTGPLKWPALEKASYIGHLVSLGWSYSEIAERLASTPNAVERHYVAFQIAEQAIGAELQGAESMESLFGVLIRALQSPGIVDFLGVAFPHDPAASKRPIPKAKASHFAEFIRWTFGTDEVDRVVTDSRQLTKWGRILQSDDSVRYLRRAAKPTFDQAWLRCGGESESVRESLLGAADHLQEAAPLVRAHRDDADVRRAVARVSEFFVQILEQFPAVLREYRIELPKA